MLPFEDPPQVFHHCDVLLLPQRRIDLMIFLGRSIFAALREVSEKLRGVFFDAGVDLSVQAQSRFKVERLQRGLDFVNPLLSQAQFGPGHGIADGSI